MEPLLFIAFGFCLGQAFAPLFYNKVFGLKFIKENTVSELLQANNEFEKINRELICDNDKLMEINEKLIYRNELYLMKLEEKFGKQRRD